MRTAPWLVSMLIVGWVGCAAPEDGGEEPEPEAPEATDVDEEAAVRAVAEGWDPAMNAEDLDAIMTLHAEDVVRLPAGEPALVGAEAVREDFAETFASTDTEQSNPVTEVRVAGDWAFAYGTYEDTTEGATETGKWVSILEKTPEGWKYAVDIWNRDAPPKESTPSERDSPALPGPTVPEDIQAAIDAWEEALVAGDVDAIMTHYTSDSRQMNPDEPTAVGLEAIRAHFEELLATPPDAAEGTVHGVDVEGDWAYVWGTWVETQGDEEASGKFLNILERTPDGWKIYVEIWNRGV